MGLKPAQQGSHPTLKPLLIKHWNKQHLPQGRRFGPSRGFGGNAPKGCWLGKLLLDEAF